MYESVSATYFNRDNLYRLISTPNRIAPERIYGSNPDIGFGLKCDVVGKIMFLSNHHKHPEPGYRANRVKIHRRFIRFLHLSPVIFFTPLLLLVFGSFEEGIANAANLFLDPRAAILPNSSFMHVFTGDSPDTVVTDVYPANGSHTAPSTATITISLSGTVNEASVTDQTVFVHGSGHGQMDGEITFGSILYNPFDDFFPGELVQTSVTTGVLDASGLPLDTPYIWSFRAAAGIGPATFPTHDDFSQGDTTAVALGDVDGDGDLDAVTANRLGNPEEVWLNDGSGGFGQTDYYHFGGKDSQDIALGDLDADGDLDAVIANGSFEPEEVWLNDGTGKFGFLPYDSFGGGITGSVALGDVDGDGDLDAVIAGGVNGLQATWLNDGTGNFGAAPYDTFGSFTGSKVVLGDLDLDGDLDAVLTGGHQNAQQVWLNDGTGMYGASAYDNFGTIDSRSLELGDVDGDGDLDVVLAKLYGKLEEVWLNDGTGNFGSAAYSKFGSRDSWGIALGDFDGDGDLDAAVANNGQLEEVWLNNGTGVFGPTAQDSFGAGSTKTYDVETGDLDGDGDLDLVTANIINQPEQAWLNTTEYFQLTVNIDGDGNGTVTSVPPGIDCGITCTALLAENSTITLTSVADEGSIFTGWIGAGCSGTDDCLIEMTAPTTVTATFAGMQASPTPTTTPTPTPSNTPVPPTTTPTPSTTLTATPSNTPVLPTATPTATPRRTATSTTTATATATPTPTALTTATPTATATPGSGSGGIIYISSTTDGSIAGLAVSDEDILIYDVVADTWATFFDGSDVGLSNADVDAFDILPDGSLLLSLNGPFRVPGLTGKAEDCDILQFIPASLGVNTAGSFAWYFDGSDVGLSAGLEDVDGVGVAPDGRVLISLEDAFTVPGVSGEDEDLLAFTPVQLGQTTSGSWEMYFDGSDVGLSETPNEDVSGFWVEEATEDIYLTTLGEFSVSGVSGDGSDVFICSPILLGDTTICSFVMFWDGSSHGFGWTVADALSVVRTASPLIGTPSTQNLIDLAREFPTQVR